MYIIKTTGQAEQIINKSRFIAVARHCTNENEVAHLLDELAQQHAKANHLAFAYRLKTPEALTQRMHDAGEPSGTAGRPILQHIEGRELINICVAVIRYFGGIKLGTGGLARAYGSSAKLAMEAATIIPYLEMLQMRVQLEYAGLDQFSRELEKVQGQLLDQQFKEQIELIVSVPVNAMAEIQTRYPQLKPV